MRVLAEKGLLLALCTILAPLFGATPDGVLIAGLLVVVSVAGLVEWLRVDARWSFLPPAAYLAVALAIPSWCVFLPLIAYDMARVGVVFRPPRLTAAIRWIWLLPLVPFGLVHVPLDDRLSPALVALVSLLGFALGHTRASSDGARRALLHARDTAREESRSARSRIADIDEERAQSIRMATLGERTRIAREIHDNVGHLLTRAIMQTQACKTVADAMGDETASQGFAAVSGTLDDAMTMVRRSVHDLEDDGTDFTAQIKDAVASFDGAGPGFAVTLTNDIAAAPAPVSRCFATVIRESLSNVAHHSAAHSANVTLRDFPAIWQLVVQDPGPAKDRHVRQAGEPSRGMGLADIESRVRTIGGTALCGPYENGWRVFVAVPKERWTEKSRNR